LRFNCNKALFVGGVFKRWVVIVILPHREKSNPMYSCFL